jgi:ditrans,polycis-polyprenyl diphosphate synthase
MGPFNLNWLYTRVATHVEPLLLAVLAMGPVPQHIAFVMDGNRRYARLRQKKVLDGHIEGFVALKRILDACLRLNIRCVTAYAFSIENFKRPQEEVDGLLALAAEKLLELAQNGALLDAYGVRLNVLGKTELLPTALQRAAHDAEARTRHNTRAILNICIPYTARDEITTAVQSAVRLAVENPSAPPITERDIEAHLMTHKSGSPPLDIFIRTSGVKRFSDFLLWQLSDDTQIQFIPKYWPDFSLWDFVPIILDYQRKVWSKAGQ